MTQTQTQKQVRVKVLMLNQLEVVGTVTMGPNSYRSRLSDLINNNQSFLVLTDVTVYQNGTVSSQSPFLCVNKSSVVFLAEDGESEMNSYLRDAEAV
jgi:hypothetical protein